ncbi:PadR family transcriptional regulator [Janibacter sp. G1551]|uniref:PadR family transcriptional regulator n=1 Tax=Janibacter sp. G1551 TaxID=3420440 RepID=UPI003D04A7D6
MSLPHALLTSLLERPSSGLDLARRFDSSIAYFWHASHQQIYRELGRMEASGWVTADETGERGGRKVHRVLPAGRAELERWTAEPAPRPDTRDALAVRLRADAVLGGGTTAATMRAHFTDRIATHEATLAGYRAIEERDFASVAAEDRAGRLRHAILLGGIAQEESSIRWCRSVLDLLEDLVELEESPG